MAEVKMNKRLPLATTLALLVAALSLRPDAQLRAVQPVDTTGRITYFIDEGERGSGYRDSDRELATWAMKAWEKALEGRLHFEPAPGDVALVQVHWVPAGANQYGETRRLAVNGRTAAAVYVRPDTSGLGPAIGRMIREDPLVRESIVYLTCLHELGHALGLRHTADIRDIMYSFEFGGDIPGFFMRYRIQLTTREDIPNVSGLSAGDIARVRAVYGRKP